MSNTVLLLDADIFCFQVASSVEQETHWGDDLWTLHSDMLNARQAFDSKVAALRERLGAREVILCFTDGENFRKQILPTYKSNRKNVRKPLAYNALVESCKTRYDTYTRPGLEADDVMGILATWEAFRPGARKVIVSEDKDLRTIGGAWLFNPARDTRPQWTDPEEAARYHLEQTLTGDATDGYAGCPGIGPETARDLLANPYGWERYEHRFKSGPRAGTTEQRWRKHPVGSPWEAVLAQYAKAGLGADVALQMARCARILHATDYNFHEKKPILWNPPRSASSSTTS